jgi:hypothetical protein
VDLSVGPDREVEAKARLIGSDRVESFKRLPNGTTGLTTSPNATAAKGGEVAVANVMHLSGSHDEL